jgi:membrane protein DedA with SNARE-associated domain
LESLIVTYGYLVIFIGTFLEGETILILAGFAARRGYLMLPGVILAAFLGSLFCDQLFFYLGRKHSQAIIARRPIWKSRVKKAQNLLERFQTPMILAFRFLYGLRTVSPFVIGMSEVSAVKFLLLNAIGALTWAIVIGSGGYLFGSALEAVIGDIKHYEIIILGGIATTGILIWIVYYYHRSNRYPE